VRQRLHRARAIIRERLAVLVEGRLALAVAFDGRGVIGCGTARSASSTDVRLRIPMPAVPARGRTKPKVLASPAGRGLSTAETTEILGTSSSTVKAAGPPRARFPPGAARHVLRAGGAAGSRRSTDRPSYAASTLTGPRTLKRRVEQRASGGGPRRGRSPISRPLAAAGRLLEGGHAAAVVVDAHREELGAGRAQPCAWRSGPARRASS
jgi:hypothetical protein